MSYRFRRDINDGKTLTFQFQSGVEFTLGIDQGDTVSSLKKFIWREKLGDLRVMPELLRVVYMKNGESVVLDDNFNIYLDEDVVMPNGDEEKISDGEISIVARYIDLDELISKLEEIKQIAVDKTEINNLIEEIPTFFTMDHEGREDACEIVAARVKNLERMEKLAFETYQQHENSDRCKETLEYEQDEEERMGQRTYPKYYFFNGDQEQFVKLDELVNWIEQNDAYRDVKDDLLRLLYIYENAIQYSGFLFLFKLLTECLER
jgi:hypothetical protein